MKEMWYGGFYLLFGNPTSLWIDTEDGPEEVDIMKDMILMQSTGLHDRHGKEIWEGDVVQSELTPHLSVDRLRFRVAWYNDAFSDYIAAEFVLIPVDGLSPPMRSFRFSVTATWWPIEVLGSIYEQPDLLKEAVKS